jgi:hypothetical protein
MPRKKAPVLEYVQDGNTIWEVNFNAGTITRVFVAPASVIFPLAFGDIEKFARERKLRFVKGVVD